MRFPQQILTPTTLLIVLCLIKYNALLVLSPSLGILYPFTGSPSSEKFSS